MVAMKRQTGPSTRTLLTIVLTVAVAFSAASFFFASFGSCGGAAIYAAFESPLLAVSRMASSISSKESYGWFDDIPDQGWKLMKLRARTSDQYMYPYQPQTGYENPVLWYLDNLQPDFTCPYKRRVGGQGDGPKWMCDPHRLLAQKDCLVYSIGSEGDYRFEESLIALLGSTHCEIHVFDPGHYARPGDPEKNNIHYHQWGLKSSYDFAYNAEVSLNALQGAAPAMKTFQETQKALGHESRTIEIFKIDCEKCEWSNYKDWVSADIRQILIENHGVPSPISGNQWHHEAMQVADYYDAFTANNFAMFSKEVNVDGGGNCVEFSYIKLHPDFWGPNGQPCMRARQQVATGSAAIETSTPNGRSVMVAGQQNSAAAAARIARQQAPAASAVLATSDPLQSLQSINIKQ